MRTSHPVQYVRLVIFCTLLYTTDHCPPAEYIFEPISAGRWGLPQTYQSKVKRCTNKDPGSTFYHIQVYQLNLQQLKDNATKSLRLYLKKHLKYTSATNISVKI